MNDFPDWLSPVVVKELRQGLRTKAFVSTFIILQVVFVLLIGIAALMYTAGDSSFNVQVVNGFFWSFVGFYLLLITPGRALTALSSEIKDDAMELVSLTRMSAWRIVCGKWISLMFQALLVLCSILPYGIIRYFFGGIDLLDDGIALFFLLLAGAFVTAVAVGISGFQLWIKIVLCIAAVATLTPSLLSFLFNSSIWSFSPMLSYISLVWNIGLLIVIALYVGAGAVASQADNFAFPKRSLCFFFLIPYSWMRITMIQDEFVVFHIIVAAGAGIAVTVMGLCAGIEDIRAQRKVFLPTGRFGKAGPLLGLCFYPTWPSAVVFSVVYGVLCFVISGTAIQVAGMDVDWDIWIPLFLLILILLWTPASLMAVLRWPRRGKWLVYIIFQIAFFVPGLIIQIIYNIFNFSKMMVLPVIWPPTFFWIVVTDFERGYVDLMWIAVAIGFLYNGVIFYFYTRRYWRKVLGSNSPPPPLPQPPVRVPEPQ